MKKKLKHIIEYAAFLPAAKVLSLLPLSILEWIGAGVGWLIYRLYGSRRKMAIDNISGALGVDLREAENIARKAFENMGKTFVEFLKLPSLGEGYYSKNVRTEGVENFRTAADAGKGVLLLGAHFGNWEMLGPAHSKHFGPMSVVYRKTDNPYVDRFIDSSRHRRGSKMIPHRNSAKKIMAALKRGEAVGILLDQHASDKDAVIVNFMGRPAATNYGLALIALKTGAPVVPLFSVREPAGRFRCIYGKPIFLEKTDDLEGDIASATEGFNRTIEKYVRQYPEQWFWIHKRWKTNGDSPPGRVV